MACGVEGKERWVQGTRSGSVPKCVAQGLFQQVPGKVSVLETAPSKKKAILPGVKCCRDRIKGLSSTATPKKIW